MLNLLNKIDISLSKQLHHFDSKVITAILQPFALLFNPKYIIIAICFVFSFNYNFLNRSRDDSIIQTLFYIFCIICNLIMTLVSKKLLRRERPLFLSTLKHKSHSHRSREKNCSLPSGDSIQAINFALNILFSFQKVNSIMKFMMSFRIDYDRLYIILVTFVILVMLARVYFMCHFIFDTVVGVTMGYYLTYYLEHIFFHSFSNTIGSNVISKINL